MEQRFLERELKRIAHLYPKKITHWDCLLYDEYEGKCYTSQATYIDGKPLAQIDKETMARSITRKRIKEARQ